METRFVLVNRGQCELYYSGEQCYNTEFAQEKIVSVPAKRFILDYLEPSLSLSSKLTSTFCLGICVADMSLGFGFMCQPSKSSLMKI